MISLPMQADATRDAWYRLMLRIAGIAAVVSVVAAALITMDFLRDRNESPLAAANIVASDQAAPARTLGVIVELKGLEAKLKAQPDSQAIKGRIRELDFALRQMHFQRRGRIVINVYILLAALGVLAAALKISTQVSKTPPGMVAVFPPPQDFWKAASSARGPIAMMSAIFVVGLVWAAVEAPGLALPFLATVKVAATQGVAVAATEAANNTTAPATTTAVAGPTDQGAAVAELMANWPSFRGATGSGVATDAAPPTEWDGAKGKNILWKSAVALGGSNSPIVWGNRVFCTGASVEKQMVYCYNADTGALVWAKQVISVVEGSSIQLNDETTFAPSTMATDGKRVYAIFPTMDVAALDFSGKEVWSTNLGKVENIYGHASSLAVCQGRLIIQFDQGDDPKKKMSRLLALDGATGEELWKTVRAVEASWASPIVVYRESGAEIVTAGKPLVAGYDPKDGHELWSAAVLEDGDVAPSPVYAAGRVFAATPNVLVALPATGKGDMSKGVLWTSTDNLPDVVSPLATEQMVVWVNAMGHIQACDAGKGKVLWEHEFDCKCHASPVLANQRIYLTDRAGVTHIFDAAAAFHEWPSCPLGEDVSGTPALAHDRIYIRAKSNLYCIGKK